MLELSLYSNICTRYNVYVYKNALQLNYIHAKYLKCAHDVYQETNLLSIERKSKTINVSLPGEREQALTS